LKKQVQHSDNKVDALALHCLYQIATGKWPAGSRLPSVRSSEEEWGLNRLTIQKAFKQLEQQGLIISKPKSGYYVSDSSTLSDITRHRYEMEYLLGKIKELICRETTLSTLSTLRYLSQLEELHEREAPDFAFCECTLIQAQGHALEIEQHYALPVMPMTLQQINGNRQRIPPHIRTLITTHFHYGELSSLQNETLKVVAIPIEVSPSLKDKICACSGPVFFVENENVSATDIAADFSTYLDHTRLEIVVTNEIESMLEKLTHNHKDPLILLSPRNWGAVAEKWRNQRFIKPVEFRICPNAWPELAESLGVALGL